MTFSQAMEPGNLWAIVLAAGEGNRMSALTKAVHGRAVPKQYASLGMGRTFLQMTMDRVAPLVPPERTVVVVAEHHAPLAEAQLEPYSGVEIVQQPQDRGPGPGVLLSLLHVLARDPRARVVLFPCDHHVRRQQPFLDAVRRALHATTKTASGVVLIGAAAETAATDLGWIELEAPSGPVETRVRKVSRFVEKPAAPLATELHVRGALWNTFVVAAGGQALLGLAELYLPEVVNDLRPYTAAIGGTEAGSMLREIYATMLPADLSRDVLQQARGLGAVTMVDTGWSDCGTPERLLQALEDDKARTWLRSRLDPAAWFGDGQAIAAVA